MSATIASALRAGRSPNAGRTTRPEPGGSGQRPAGVDHGLPSLGHPDRRPAQVRRDHLVGSRGHEHEAGDAGAEHVGMGAAELHQTHATHRVADDDGVAEVEALEHGGDVVAERAHAVAGGPGDRPAVSTEVDGDDPVPVGELLQLGCPHVGAQGDAVQQDQRAARSPLEVVERAAVAGGHGALDGVVRDVEHGVGHGPDGPAYVTVTRSSSLRLRRRATAAPTATPAATPAERTSIERRSISRSWRCRRPADRVRSGRDGSGAAHGDRSRTPPRSRWCRAWPPNRRR